MFNCCCSHFILQFCQRVVNNFRISVNKFGVRELEQSSWNFQRNSNDVVMATSHLSSNECRLISYLNEWTNAIKMSTNIAAVRSVPGRSCQDQNCRHPGCSEIETLEHVLGYCPKEELLGNNRHHKVRSSIATTLRKAKWEVYEEVHCLAENGSTRRADIIAIDRRNQRSLILDPTVRFEKDDQQANNVNDEKKSIYNPCIPHFSERYKMNINTWEVKGLLLALGNFI
ncbi:hypothetical protein ANN_16409 [Periplaneta americana]|uniref:Reverse transcriptase n=1 Tax=Periplaneta americana TaxID=6978 RepID=A0ABQ8SJP2_PERAM|nr:hypothetical protein ANN_16409 [Periplaneta americana]